MTHVYLDIESLPDMREGALQAFIDDAKENFKAPSTLTKEQAAAELGLTDKEKIKFTSKEAMIADWVSTFKEKKGPEVAEQEWHKTALNGAAGQVLMIGLAFDDADPVVAYADTEAETLSIAFDMIRQRIDPNRRPVFIGHNVTGFDLRFIFQRAVIKGVQPPLAIPFGARPWDDSVFDTMTQWAGHGNRISLDNLCTALGLPGKGEIDGGQVYDYWKAGRIAELIAYCADDVHKAREVHRRMTFQLAA
ncbi:putative 3'-5' exonuclease related to the exonuclease domain of PolB [compost metagenome]